MAEAKDDYSGGDKVNASEVNQNAKNANDAGGFRDSLLAGETINGGTLPVPIYQNTSDNEFYKCDANDTDKLNFVGFAISNSTDGNAIDLQMTGIVRGFSGLAEGEKYYVQDAVGTIGTPKGTIEVLVGIAISETELLILKGNFEYIGSAEDVNGGSFDLAIPLGARKAIIQVFDAKSGNATTGKAELGLQLVVFKIGLTSAYAHSSRKGSSGGSSVIEYISLRAVWGASLTGKLFSVSNASDAEVDYTDVSSIKAWFYK